MYARAKPVAGMNTGGSRIDREYRDIIECALVGDLQGVDAALASNPRLINAQRTGSGITPLMAASGRNIEKMVKHLLTKEGVDLALVDDFGRTALDHGRIFRPIVALLMAHSYPGLNWKEPLIHLVPPSGPN